MPECGRRALRVLPVILRKEWRDGKLGQLPQARPVEAQDQAAKRGEVIAKARAQRHGTYLEIIGLKPDRPPPNILICITRPRTVCPPKRNKSGNF